MTDVSRDTEMSYQPGAMTRASLALTRYMTFASLVATLALVLGLALPWPAVGLALFTTGSGVFVVFALARLLSLRHHRNEMKLRDLIAALSDNDPAPVFATYMNGGVCYQNHAARLKFGDLAGGGLLGVFERYVVSPAATLHRLQSRAVATGVARDELTAGKDAVSISAHSMGGIGCYWRIEQAQAPATAASGVALPMLTVGRSGQVLFSNTAFVDLIGRREPRLGGIVADLPLRDGEIHELITNTGTIRRRLAEVPGEGGRTDLYFLPVSDATEVSDWTVEDAFPVPMVKLSRDGRILLANQMARDLLGRDKLQGIGLLDVVEGLGRPLQDWLSDAAAGRGLKRPEILRARRKDREIFLQFTLGRITEEGEIRLIGVLSDATELKSLEAQFVQSQKMQAIGQLAGGVAHDFNNLLTAISGHCDLLLLRHEHDDPEYDDLMQISQNANRAASLVGQLLAFSRKQNLQPEVLDLCEVISDHTHLLSRLVGEQLKLEVNHPAELPKVRADRRQFEQVMMNLVVNARDAMKGSSGTIKITTSERKLPRGLQRDRAVMPAGDYVLISVEDTGCGIAEDKLDKIFEPFYTTKKAGEGTGLGLSTVYGIVKQSGGFIFADSVLGRGTQFSLYFPAERGRAAALPEVRQPVVAMPVSRDSAGVVLLVEDEAPVRAFASRALKMCGHTIIEAESAEDALHILEDKDLVVDIFVSDVIMPGMDGPTWVSEALKERPNTRVVFVSGYSEDSVTDHRSRIPNSVFLPKPFSLTDLTSTVREQMKLAS